jgi:hypothetical protein
VDSFYGLTAPSTAGELKGALAVVMGSPFVKWITTQRNAQVIQRQQF